jgi:hypothetical protein
VPVWNVELRGPMTREVEMALGRFGILAGGTTRSLRGSESHDLPVRADTAGEAVQRTKAATAGSAVTVRKALGPVAGDP